MPTGSGKTFTFVDMARMAAERHRTVLILTHRAELFAQTHTAFAAFGLVPYKINQDSDPPAHSQGVFVVMVETLANRQHLLDSLRPDLIIIDEAHYANFNKMIDQFPDAYVLGVTATPVGKHFVKYYTNIVQPIDTPELIEQGYLVPYKAYQMVDDISGLRKGASGDYSETSQFAYFNKEKLYRGVVEEWEKRCSGQKTIVFNCNIKHSNFMAESFRAAGIESYSLTSKTSPDDRKKILAAFENGTCNVLNNTGILTAGYDYPPTSCIVLNRATASLALYLQMLGRGSRTAPGKTEFVALDFGGNHTRHGMWSNPRVWGIGEEKKKTKVGEAVVKECPKCEAMLSASLRHCPYCGYQFPLVIVKLKDGVMQEYYEKDIPVKPVMEYTPQDFVILVRTGKMKANQAIGFMRRKEDEKEAQRALMEYAHAMGFRMGWVGQQMRLRK